MQSTDPLGCRSRGAARTKGQKVRDRKSDMERERDRESSGTQANFRLKTTKAEGTSKKRYPKRPLEPG